MNSMHSTIDLDLVRRYDVKGPRYTSYPTALQFADFTVDQYLEAVRTSPRSDGELSLYVHIPFCRHLCYYCACSKIVTRDRAKAGRYLDYLKREIAMQAPWFAGRQVTQLHWGGGTPTFLDDAQVLDLMAHIRACFELADDTEGEFGIEIDPRTVDAERVKKLREAGFNRLSFGIQDFDEQVQEAVNRRQSFHDTQIIMQAARENGFRSVSVDLIYGLPHQSITTICETLDKVVALSPDRISIYNYAHLPDRFPPQKRINITDLPRAEEKLQILKCCIDRLTSGGYCDIGMDHFARPDDELARAQQAGKLHRNFQGYSTHADCDMVAVGLTAISQVGSVYAQNAKDMDSYEALIDGGRLPIVRGVSIDSEDQVRRAIIMALICQFTLEFSCIDRQFGIDMKREFARELAQLQPMVDDGLLVIDSNGMTVTAPGRLLIRNICMTFDRYLNPADEHRFSRAI